MQVDFYVLNETNRAAQVLYACRLLEKAYQHAHRCFVYVDNEVQAQQLDQLLWTFRDDSFVPHAIISSDPSTLTPILISHNAPPEELNDIFLNLHSDEVPGFHQQFHRIVEIVYQESNSKVLSRKHYRYYREQNYQLQSHKIGHH